MTQSPSVTPDAFRPARPPGTVLAPVAPDVQLVSVNVGLPRPIGTDRSGEPILSGIVKTPVTADTLRLDPLNLEGDRQADLAVHGGPDKAVYAYPSEHLPRWNEELGVTFGPGTFGENLTVAGWLEEDVRIGDVWAWGNAFLQVSQPRSPCYKLATVTGRPDLPKRLTRNGRTGWYLRVLQPGNVSTAGPIHVVDRHPAGLTVLRFHRAALLGDATRADLEHMAAVEPLAAFWKARLREQLDLAP